MTNTPFLLLLSLHRHSFLPSPALPPIFFARRCFVMIGSHASPPPHISHCRAVPMALSSSWDGSNVHEDHIEFLRKTRRLPSADKVEVRLAPVKELTPEPREGERVVFRSHFLRGIGLPASAFFCCFLEFYQLQPHHLTPNTVVLLSAFVTLCEGFLGVLPTLELWGNSSKPSSAPACRACRLRAAPSSRCGSRQPTTPSPSSR